MAKILIVDDYDLHRDLLKRAICEFDADNIIIEADSGENALKALDKELPDLILCDIMMPKMSGFELCKILKADKRFQTIPIIFITAVENTEQKIEGFEMGAADYITKPINAAEVKVRVNSHLRIKKENEYAAIKKMIITYNHEMRQPLSAIEGYADILLDELDKDGENHEMAKIISEQTTRIKTILDKIAALTTFVTTDYIEGSSMIDLKLEESE